MKYCNGDRKLGAFLEISKMTNSEIKLVTLQNGCGSYKRSPITHVVITKKSAERQTFFFYFFTPHTSHDPWDISSCSLIISLAPCSISQFFAAPCSLFQIFCAPCSQITFSPRLIHRIARCPLPLVWSWWSPYDWNKSRSCGFLSAPMDHVWVTY